MTSFFKDAVRLMNKLNYPKKLFFLVAISIFIVSVLTFQLISQSKSILDFSNKELLGVQYINPLIQLNKNLQEYRKIKSIYTAGDEAASNMMNNVLNQIELDISNIDINSQKLGQELQTSNKWNDIKNKWQAFRLNKDTPVTTNNITLLINEIQKLIITACDNSNLTLDPDIDTYYLMDSYCTKVPSYIEELALIQVIGHEAIINKSLPQANREQLVINTTLMDQFNMLGIAGNIEKVLAATPSLSTTLLPLIRTLVADTNSITSLLNNTLLSNNFNLSGADLTQKSDSLTNLSYKLYQEIGTNLYRLLQSRIQNILHLLYFNVVISIIGLLFLIYLFAGVYLSVMTSIHTLVEGSKKLAEGDLTSTVKLETQDELVEVATSFNLMRDRISKIMTQFQTIISEITRVLGGLSQGNLTERITNTYEGSFGDLIKYVNLHVENLEKLINDIKISSQAVNLAAKNIAVGNDDLAKRTDQQAAFLEETAASIEEVTASGKNNEINAKQANELAQSASDVATKGGTVISEVVNTMMDINESSKKVAEIISIIENIAFQTNILALNAAVEAARAGEQGRGFAVVAAEVRNLAQRTAEAAKESKLLISTSVEKVDGGTKLVDQAGETMTEIVKAVRQVTEIMSDIAGASVEQRSGIEQVNQAIVQIDQVTQKNNTLVINAAKAAKSMETQASYLNSLVKSFKINSQSIENSAHFEKTDEDNQQNMTGDQSLSKKHKETKDIWKEF